MRSGDIYEVAAVLKSLTLLSKSKNSPTVNGRCLDKSKYLVVSEIASVSNLEENESSSGSIGGRGLHQEARDH